MNQSEAVRAMNRIANRTVTAGQAVDLEALHRAASQVASQVLIMAQRAGHSLSIKVTDRPDGVRISVTGSKAHRYRTIINAELERLSPQTAAEVQAQIVRKIR